MLIVNESIAIVDKNKTVRLRLGLDNETEEPFISLHDSDGHDRLVIRLDGGNGGIALLTTEGQPLMTMEVSRNSGMGVTLVDVPNDTRLTIEIANGKGAVQLETTTEMYSWPPKRPEDNGTSKT